MLQAGGLQNRRCNCVEALRARACAEAFGMSNPLGVVSFREHGAFVRNFGES